MYEIRTCAEGAATKKTPYTLNPKPEVFCTPGFRLLDRGLGCLWVLLGGSWVAIRAPLRVPLRRSIGIL